MSEPLTARPIGVRPIATITTSGITPSSGEIRLRGRVRLGWLIADHDVQAAVGVTGPQQLLVVLAHAGARHLVHERPLVRQPPLDHPVGQMRPELLRAHRLTRYTGDAG